MGLGFLVLLGGALFVYAGIKDVNVWDEVKSGLGMGPAPEGGTQTGHLDVGGMLGLLGNVGAAVGVSGKPTTSGGGSPAITGGATAGIKAVQKAVYARFGHVQSYGVCSCRGVFSCSNPGTPGCPWSQHAYCNAWDIHADVHTMDAIAHFLVANRQKLKCAHVIWQGHDLLSGGAVADHYDHVHVDCNPQGVGTPPCAGGRK